MERECMIRQSAEEGEIFVCLWLEEVVFWKGGYNYTRDEIN